MNKILKLTPFLLAVFPVIFLYNQNKNEITYHVLWWPLLSVAVLTAVVFLVVYFFEKNSTKLTLISSLIIVVVLYYGFAYDLVYGLKLTGVTLGRHKYLFPLWVLLGVNGLFWLKITKKELGNLVRILCFSAFILVLSPSFEATYYNLNSRDTNEAVPNSETKEPNINDDQKISAEKPLPDIYYIVPDAYAGPKILSKYFNFDNKEFYAYLKKKGFTVAENSRSSYPNTYFSVASTLNMERINYLSEILGKDSQDYNLIRQILNDNRVLRQLKLLGYKYIHLDSDYTTFLAGDPLAVETPTDIFARMLMKFTILRPFGGRYGFKENAINDRLRDNILSTFDSLEKSATEAGPKFVFAHITSPHGPYVFDRNGSKVSGQFDNNIEELNYYLDQLVYINARLSILIDKILSSAEVSPIIIIQSDHGFYIPPEILISSDYDTVKFNVRMANFAAYYLPKNKCKSALPQSINAVNAFRFIFDNCFGTRYGLLKNESYYFTNQSRPYDLLKVDYSKDPF